MSKFLSERNIVVVLFVMVLITFSLAQEDSKKMEKMYSGINSAASSAHLLVLHETNKTSASTAPAE